MAVEFTNPMWILVQPVYTNHSDCFADLGIRLEHGKKWINWKSEWGCVCYPFCILKKADLPPHGLEYIFFVECH